MKTATAKELKDELRTRSKTELLELCLRLARFKKENKELMTYYLFEAENESGYIQGVQGQVDIQFDQINRKNYYFIKKGVRKILREIKKYIRYTPKKETEVELLLYFCHKLREMKPSYQNNRVLSNIYERQLALIESRMVRLHEDLQYEYQEEVDLLKS